MTAWNYLDNGGARGWGRLTLPGTDELAFPDCNGSRQSPIDIPLDTPISGIALALDYRPTRLSVTNTGFSLQVDCEHGGSSFTSTGKKYALQQFHFHAPGEHRLDGTYGDLELHFVHQDPTGQFAVVGVLVHMGEPSPAFQQILDLMPLDVGNASTFTTINPRYLLPADHAHYAYDGSLTTPPCTENVRWFVLVQRITASREQIERFRALPFLNPKGRFVGNARPVQPLNGRFSSR